MLGKPIKEIKAHIDNISQGELSVTLNYRSDNEMGDVADNLRNMSDKLRNIVDNIMDGADNIVKASMQLSSVSQQIEQGANEQAASAGEHGRGFAVVAYWFH